MPTAGAPPRPDWLSDIVALDGLSPEDRRALRNQSRLVAYEAGSRLFAPGTQPSDLLMILRGTVRVQKTSGAGREIVLYRVHGGDSCILTTACLLAHRDYQAEAVAETNVQTVAVPRALFEELMQSSSLFRQFVFQAYAARITELLGVIEEVAFRRVDIRLAQKLLDRAGDGTKVDATHQQLAAELGTAREVVSRNLKEFERRGWVQGGRGHLGIENKAALTELATSA